MKKEMMNGVQGPPGALESNAKNSREKAQEAQAPKTFGVGIFALLRGHSVGANPGRLDSRKARRAEAAAAKAGQTNAQDVKLG
jgi:hypothetical protein